jgi:hypothetical protein
MAIIPTLKMLRQENLKFKVNSLGSIVRPCLRKTKTRMGEKCVVISLDISKAFDKIHYSLMVKTLSKPRNRRELLQLDKTYSLHQP